MKVDELKRKLSVENTLREFVSRFMFDEMVYCTVINCKHSSNKRYGNRISFYRLPKEPEVRKLWIETLKKRKVPRSENSIRICNVHFEKSLFERDLNVWFIFNFFPILVWKILIGGKDIG